VWSVFGRVMELVVTVILVCGFLNLIPWILLLYSRPDLKIEDRLVESDSALAQLIQIIMQKMDSLEEMGQGFGGAAGEFNLGHIIGQILQQKMNQGSGNDYMRDSAGRFNGTPEIIETSSETLD